MLKFINSNIHLEYGALLSTMLVFASLISHIVLVDNEDIKFSKTEIVTSVIFLTLFGVLSYNAIKCLRSGKKCIMTASTFTLTIMFIYGVASYAFLEQIINPDTQTYTITTNGVSRTVSQEEFNQFNNNKFQ